MKLKKAATRERRARLVAEHPVNNADMDIAKSLLLAGHFSHVLVKNGSVISTSHKPGVIVLLSTIETAKLDTLRGASLCDKVVGRAVAAIAQHCGFKAVHGLVVSKPAADDLRRARIRVSWDREAEAILDRSGADLCPFEKAVAGCSNAEEAYKAIRRLAEKLKRE